MNARNQSQEVKYFDLHTNGIGYLNRVRLVTPEKGPKYLACSISALRGSADDVQYSWFDVIVTGNAAKDVVTELENEANDANTKVLVSFRIGDVTPQAFTYAKGERKGQTGASLRGRLIKVMWARVNGELVYEAPKAENPADGNGNSHIDDEPAVEEQHDDVSEPRATRATQANRRSSGGSAGVSQMRSQSAGRRSSGGFSRRAA